MEKINVDDVPDFADVAEGTIIYSRRRIPDRTWAGIDSVLRKRGLVRHRLEGGNQFRIARRDVDPFAEFDRPAPTPRAVEGFGFDVYRNEEEPRAFLRSEAAARDEARRDSRKYDGIVTVHRRGTETGDGPDDPIVATYQHGEEI